MIRIRRSVTAARLPGDERLGHWSPSLTLTIYEHAIKRRQRELARAIGATLG
jgi:hypothetical protein